MNNKLSVVIALAAGLAGGLLTRYIAPTPVFAQAPNMQAPNAQAPAPAAANEVRAHSFALVDIYGRVAGTFRAEPATGGYRQEASLRIVLRDADGHEIWSAPGMVHLMSEGLK